MTPPPPAASDSQGFRPFARPAAAPLLVYCYQCKQPFEVPRDPYRDGSTPARRKQHCPSCRAKVRQLHWQRQRLARTPTLYGEDPRKYGPVATLPIEAICERTLLTPDQVKCALRTALVKLRRHPQAGEIRALLREMAGRMPDPEQLLREYRRELAEWQALLDITFGPEVAEVRRLCQECERRLQQLESELS